ncbi:DUF4233 domain-containing protein [Nocardioides lentus]|uniref:DUF4233 domain-containing protein n=1 Tax=Nocardioides lentus TaxID=338077 RepID=A0ABN2PLL8_9ACTN
MSGTGELRPDGVPRAGERSPRRGMCAAVLSLQAITLGLTTPVMITLSDVPTGAALAVGLGLTVVCILLAGMLRREWAYGVGYLVQGAAVGLGFVVTTMFFLGAVFAALWTTADLLGRKIERERAAAWAAYEAQRGPSEA